MDHFETCVFDADHEALEEVLINNPVHQIARDRWLECGLRIVQRLERKLSHLARTLTMLLQSGSKWNSDTLLDEQKTPYHVICESEGDHHELLDLMMKSSQRVAIDAQDIYKHTALMYAVRNTNINCIKKLIENGARLDIIGFPHRYIWTEIANMGNVELLKCMFNHGINKNTINNNHISVLWYVVNSGNAEAVRYLLDSGAVIPTNKLGVQKGQCKRCEEKTLIIDDDNWEEHEVIDPRMRAICCNNLEMVKLLDEYGSQSYRSFNALRCAVSYGKVDVVSYLLKTYTYPLNIEYRTDSYPSRVDRQRYTLLTEDYLVPVTPSMSFDITKLLLDHGADPTKQMCGARSASALISAIKYRNVKVIAQYIRSGVDINFRSYDHRHGKVLPFEASVMRGYHDVSEMLLISGCSCGQFSLINKYEDKVDLKPELRKLMKDWKVQENNVKPLKLRCRSVILNHLSPRADMKIEKLPLPGLLRKFLSIIELDVMLDLKSGLAKCRHL